METTKEITATFNVPTAVIDNIVNEITSRVMTKMSDTLRTISDILVDEVSTVKTMVKTMVENKVAEAVQTVTGNDIPANDDAIESKVAEAVENNENPADKSDETPAAEATETPVDEATSTPVNEAENQPKQAFDYMAVQKYCEEVVNAVLNGTEQGEFGKEDENILKMSNGLVHAYLGKCRGFSPRFNFRDTKQVVGMFGHFNGFLKNNRIASVLEQAFSGHEAETTHDENADEVHDCDTPIAERRKRRGTPFKNQSYMKVMAGSHLMKIRVRADGTIAPMVLDRELGQDMIENHFTHVTLTTSKNGKDIFMVFTEQDKRTHAPNNSPTIARLSIYGRNHHSGEPTTYTISSRKFQETIAKHFGFDSLPNQEFFISFTGGTSGVHKTNGQFKRFKGKKYYSVKLEMTK